MGYSVNNIGGNHPISYILIGVVGVVASAASLIITDTIAVLIAPAIIILVYLAIRFPEFSFVLFMNAGMFKDDQKLKSLQELSYFDLTLFFEFLCILGILIEVLRGKIKIFCPPAKMLIAYLAIAGMSAFSLVYTEAPIYGQEKLVRFLVITSFSLWGPWFLFQNWKRINRFFIAWLTLSTAMVFDILGEGLKPGEVLFRSAFSGSSGYLGLGYVTAQSVLIIMFAFFLKATNIWNKLFYLSLMILNVIGMLISGARTSPWIFLAIMAIVLVFNAVHSIGYHKLIFKVQRRDVRVMGSIVVWMFLLIVISLWAFEMDYLTTLVERTAWLSEAKLERTSFFISAAEAVWRFPLGLGIGGFSTYYFHFDGRAFPHNIFLEVGSELGWIGLVAFVLLCYWSLRAGLQILKENKDQYYFFGIALLSLFWYVLLYFQFHGDINDARGFFAWIGSMFAYHNLMVIQNAKYAYEQKSLFSYKRTSVSL